MANYLKNNAVGLDKKLNELQEWIYDKLVTDYSWSDFECYGRAYLNKNPREQEKKVFEVAVNGKDYKEITMDDKHTVTSYFYKTRLEQGEITKATVVLFFNINLKKLFNQSATRMDEDAVNDILNVLSINAPGFELGEIKTGTENVYGSYGINSQDRDNMSDYMVCSVEMTITYLHNYC